MTTLRCLDYRDCATHGRSLFVSCHCIECAKDGIPPPIRPPIKEPISAWMRKAICGVDSVKRGPVAKVKKIDHAGRPRSKTLTPKEQRVVNALAEGITNYRLIAAYAGINKRSVARCIEAAMQRMAVRDVAELKMHARSSCTG